MANICTTNVTISGEPDAIKKLYDILSDVSSLDIETYNTLFTNTENEEIDWGSKWQQISAIDYWEDSDILYIEGESAWNPAIGLWKQISKEYHTSIELTYTEQGQNFAGNITFQNGEITHEYETTYYEYIYENDNDQFWYEMDIELSCEPLDVVIDLIQDIYDTMSDEDKERLEEISNQYNEEDEE